MNNLFIVGTPLQLICAVEAITHFNLENNILIMVHRSQVANKLQMKDLIQMHDWKDIINIEYSKNSSLLKYVKLVRQLKMNKYKYVFISKLETVPKIVIANVVKEKVYLLDDGGTTVWIYEKFIKTNKINKYNFKELRFLLFGLKIKIKDKINLYTIYNLKPFNEIEVVNNKFVYLKAKYLKECSPDKDNIYMLGQPIQGMIGVEAYFEILLKIIKKFKKKMIYIPHRGESQETLLKISSMQDSLFELLDINQPVELYFLENKISPNYIISYYSAALTTLSLIFESKVNFIKLPKITGKGDEFDRIIKIYYDLHKGNNIIDIKDL